ncbi:MAG: phosphoglucosamine mutase [Bifidobacteriaceae bacterium]|jgi:phosphoglucosamine mutase|nr:phosphoglucosamine mutase [Bifidobacteriaceae bacterium]
MARLFGTDGVRGLAGRDITAELAVDLAAAAARVLGGNRAPGVGAPRALIGNDSRISGGYLTAAVAAGLAGAGVDVLDVGVLPTPGLAYLVATQDVDLAVMLSASHNPMADNGIKFFARGGFKLPDTVEDLIEASLREPWERPTGESVGRIRTDHLAPLAYVDHLVDAAPVRLAGLKIVLDCANGAASEVAPEVMRRLGADVVPLACTPDGLNINAGVGSTHPEMLRRAVVREAADLGFAFDGDADRCLAVDDAGDLVDGDRIMAILAIAMKERGALANNTLVATVMSNLALHHAMRDAGIELRATDVGDRYVLEDMLAGGYTLGGEQSGHVIMTEFGTTGDGVLTAVQVASQLALTGRTMAQLASVIQPLPQVLVNVAGVDKARVETDAGVARALADARERLGDMGRILLRPSGTEPLVRVMVEAATYEMATEVAGALADAVREHLTLADTGPVAVPTRTVPS